MDCRNYVRSSTWRPDAEGTEGDDGELDDDNDVIDIKIL
jgi:hypothetical protein